MDTHVEPNSDQVHLCIRCGLGLHPDAAVCPRCGAQVPEFQAASKDTDPPADPDTQPSSDPTFGYVPSSGATPGYGSKHGFAPQPEFGSEPATHPHESPSAFDPGPLPDGDPQPEEPLAPHLLPAGAVATEPPSSSYLEDLQSSPAGVPNVAATPEPPVPDHAATQEWEAIPAGFDVAAGAAPHDAPDAPASDAINTETTEPPPPWDAISPADDWDREPAASPSVAAQPLPAVNLAPRPAQTHRRWQALGWALAVLAIIAAVVGFSMASHQKHVADDARALARRQTEAVAQLHSEVAALTLRLHSSSNITTGIKVALAKCRSAISLDTQYASFVQDIVTGIARLDRAAYDRGTAGVASLGPKIKAANESCLAGANA